MTRKIIAPGLDPKETKISFIMEAPLITLDASLPMNEALLSMKKNHIRHIVATVAGEVVGILSIHDFAHYHSRKISDPVSSFWSNSEVLLDEESFKYALDKLLSGMADKLGDSSKTERAIRNKEPLAQFAQQAKEEGLNDFLDILKLSIDIKWRTGRGFALMDRIASGTAKYWNHINEPNQQLLDDLIKR